jgi:hypothetical protein
MRACARACVRVHACKHVSARLLLRHTCMCLRVFACMSRCVWERARAGGVLRLLP